jgi:hypothetical protein
MRRKLEALASLVLMAVLRRYRRDITRLARIEATALYVKTVRGTRLTFLSGIGVALCLCVLLAGFILIHVALLVCLPWTIRAKALLLLVCGIVYMLVAGGILISVSREDYWMRISKARELVEKATSDL